MALIGVKEGDAPKEFVLNDLNGATVNVGDVIGKKPVILVFWELAMSKAFLDYSMDELRFLSGFYNIHHDTSGLEIFSIYTPEEDKEIPDSEIEKVKDLIKVNKIKFPVLIDSGFKIFREYGVIALPSTIMIDKTGKITFIYPSFPLAARPLFTEKINTLIGLAETVEKKEAEKTKGKDSHSVRLYNYALQMYKHGLLEQALSPLKKSLELDPDLTSSHNLMGIVLWKRGNFEGSVEEFKHAIKLDNNNVPAQFNYGLLLFESEKYTEAEKHFRKVISLDDKLAEVHYVLGLLYKKTNREREAMEELGSALVLFEERKTASVYEIYSPAAYQRISALYALSELHGRKGEAEKALDLLQKAVKITLGLEMKSEQGHLYRSRDLMIYE
jgi:Tfp pilus assembly protein PilF/alkyl hydroperoxide reductase subunit AhpC